MSKSEGDDYIVLPNGTRVWGLTPEWIQKSNHHMRVTALACMASEETGVPVSELREEVLKQVPLESVTVDMDKFNKFMEEGRARRDALKAKEVGDLSTV